MENPSLNDIFDDFDSQVKMLNTLKMFTKSKPEEFPSTSLKKKKSTKEIENRLAKIRLDKFENVGPQTGDILIWPDKTIVRLMYIKDRVAYTCNRDKTIFTILESGNAFAIGAERIIHNKEACISTDKLIKIGISAEIFVTTSLEEICVPVYMWTTI